MQITIQGETPMELQRYGPHGQSMPGLAGFVLLAIAPGNRMQMHIHAVGVDTLAVIGELAKSQAILQTGLTPPKQNVTPAEVVPDDGQTPA